jgi:hypothetical protein
MIDFKAFGLVTSNAETAYVAGALDAFLQVSIPAVMITRHRAPAAHAAWAVDAIAPQRKRRTAAATDASVDRGFL